MRVGVTGVGGGVGQSIMKALTLSSLPVDIYAIDVQPQSAGLYRATEGLRLPRPESPGGIEEWEAALTDKGVEALIPGSDHDLLPLAAARDDWATRDVCQVLVSDLELVRQCRDKAATHEVLQKAGLPVPRSAWDLSTEEAVSWAADTGYPVVIKPRDGSGSRHVHVAEDEEEVRFYHKRTPRPILQGHLSLSGDIQEFTCAVFVDRDGSPVGTFMARRDLSGGSTYRAEVGFWPDIHELLLAIGSELRPKGPVNVQLRLTERGPVPFELNVRCSGTTAIRAYFGYNEPEMLLRHYALGEDVPTPTPRTGYALRYWNEVFLDGMGANDLERAANGLRGKVLAWP